jgi:hypothetical protein
MILLVSNITGCCISPSTKPIAHKFNNVDRLIELPDAEKAKEHAPIFTKEALRTVIDLEYALESSQ